MKNSQTPLKLSANKSEKRFIAVYLIIIDGRFGYDILQMCTCIIYFPVCPLFLIES